MELLLSWNPRSEITFAVKFCYWILNKHSALVGLGILSRGAYISFECIIDFWVIFVGNEDVFIFLVILLADNELWLLVLIVVINIDIDDGLLWLSHPHHHTWLTHSVLHACFAQKVLNFGVEGFPLQIGPTIHIFLEALMFLDNFYHGLGVWVWGFTGRGRQTYSIVNIFLI